jgi:hypothetical protein
MSSPLIPDSFPLPAAPNSGYFITVSVQRKRPADVMNESEVPSVICQKLIGERDPELDLLCIRDAIDAMKWTISLRIETRGWKTDAA